MATYDNLAHVEDRSDEGSHHQDAVVLKQGGMEEHVFYMPKCSVCKCEMQFSEGDVIYGDKWYHSACWDEVKKLVGTIS